MKFHFFSVSLSFALLGSGAAIAGQTLTAQDLDPTACHYQLVVNDPLGKLKSVEVLQYFSADSSPKGEGVYKKRCMVRKFAPSIDEDNGYGISLFDKTPISETLRLPSAPSLAENGKLVFQVSRHLWGETDDCVFKSRSHAIVLKAKTTYPKTSNSDPNRATILLESSRNNSNPDLDGVDFVSVTTAGPAVSAQVVAKDSNSGLNRYKSDLLMFDFPMNKGPNGHECPTFNGKTLTIDVK